MRTNKTITFFLIAVFCLSFMPQSYAAVKQGAASLFVPTTGQAMNGQLGNGKTKMMGAIEVASITAVTVLGIATGGATVLFGAIPLAANHLWSATDAYSTAKKNEQNGYYMNSQQQLYDAQRNLDLSRQGRYDREYDFRDRIRRAGETANG